MPRRRVWHCPRAAHRGHRVHDSTISATTAGGALPSASSACRPSGTGSGATPTPPCARRGLAVRVPPRGHRVLTYPRPFTAEAPGQYRLRAALLAPGHEPTPRRLIRCATRHDRPSAAPRAPGADVPPAIAAEAPGQYRLSAVANATVALPAGQRTGCFRRGLPRTPANPRTQTHSLTNQHHRPHPHQALPLSHPSFPRKRESTSPRISTGGPQGGYAPATRPIPLSFLHVRILHLVIAAESRNPAPGPLPPKQKSTPCSKCWRGLAGGVTQRTHPISHQVQPAIQVPPHPRPCSTAATGLHRHHPSRAPPTLARRLVIAAQAAIHVPLHCGGTTGGPALSPLSKCWRGARGVRTWPTRPFDDAPARW